MIPSIEQLFSLKGRVAVISDCGGLSSTDIAPVLAAAGAMVVIADKDGQKGEGLATAISAEGGHATAIATDITSEQEVARLFAVVEAQHGNCDILVNCAGLTNTAPITETSLELYEELHALNQLSTFLLMREGVRLMVKQGRGGRIVNVTTMGSLHPVLHGNAAYAATRASVTALTRSVALDHARDGILANLVLPGAIPGKTAFHPDMQRKLADGTAITGPATDDGRLPLGYGSGSDIGAAVLYLVGPSGRYMTGQSITLDGGFLLS